MRLTKHEYNQRTKTNLPEQKKTGSNRFACLTYRCSNGPSRKCILGTSTANTLIRSISSPFHNWIMGSCCENGIKIEKVG